MLGNLWPRAKAFFSRLFRRKPPEPGRFESDSAVRRCAGWLATAPWIWPVARLHRLRSARPRALAPRAARRPHPRLPADGGRDRPRDAHHRAGGRRGLPRAAAAPEPARERVGMLELVRPGDGCGAGRDGDRARAGARGAAQIPDRSPARVRRRDVVGRRARDRARREEAASWSPACSCIRASPAARRRRRWPRSACERPAPTPTSRGSRARRARGRSRTRFPCRCWSIHGGADDVVAPVNAAQLVRQYLALNGHPAAEAGADIELPPPDRSRASRRADARTVTTSEWMVAGRVVARHVLIDGLGHAWSGGDDKYPYNDPHRARCDRAARRVRPLRDAVRSRAATASAADQAWQMRRHA